jgi:hypothetical protein
LPDTATLTNSRNLTIYEVVEGQKADHTSNVLDLKSHFQVHHAQNAHVCLKVEQRPGCKLIKAVLTSFRSLAVFLGRRRTPRPSLFGHLFRIIFATLFFHFAFIGFFFFVTLSGLGRIYFIGSFKLLLRQIVGSVAQLLFLGLLIGSNLFIRDILLLCSKTFNSCDWKLKPCGRRTVNEIHLCHKASAFKRLCMSNVCCNLRRIAAS